ncbi:MAG: hypothetical protein R3D00_21405 [Bacteroidia bacterium]
MSNLEILIKSLGIDLKKKNFYFVEDQSLFTRVFELGEFRFHISSMSDGARVSCDYGIRFELVEKVIDLFYNRPPDRELDTVFIHTGELLVKTEDYKFYILNSDEINFAKDRLLGIFQKFAIPYFESYSSFSSLNHLLNSLPYESKKLRNDKYHNETLSGFFRGLTVAKLLNRDDLEKIFLWQLKFLLDNNYQHGNIEHLKTFYEFIYEVEIL